MKGVTNESERAVGVDLHLLMADYWHEIDVNGAASASDYFTQDCIFDPSGRKIYHGREGVRAFYDDRATRGQRTTRHTFSNLRMALANADEATFSVVVVNYGADGPAPITDFLGASLVSQVTCRCVRADDGIWRFASLRGEPVFIGKEPYTRQVLVEGAA